MSILVTWNILSTPQRSHVREHAGEQQYYTIRPSLKTLTINCCSPPPLRSLLARLPQKSKFLFSIWGYRFFPPPLQLTLKIKNLILCVWGYLRFYYCSMRNINPICMRFLLLLYEVSTTTTAVGEHLSSTQLVLWFPLGLVLWIYLSAAYLQCSVQYLQQIIIIE